MVRVYPAAFRRKGALQPFSAISGLHEYRLEYIIKYLYMGERQNENTSEPETDIDYDRHGDPGRAAEDGARVLFDVAPAGKAVQNPGETLGSDTPAAQLLSQAYTAVTRVVVQKTEIGGEIFYSTLYPVFREQAAGDPASGGEQQEPLFLIVPYIRSSEVPDYPILFTLQIIVQFSGIFIILLSFGFWISRFYLIYPVTAMSSRTNQISGSLDDIVILDQEADVWLALTGDQCAITNIRITHAE